MINQFESFATEFAGEIKPRLPWAQIINIPDLTPQQLQALNPAHGLFITDDNIALAGISTTDLEANGFTTYQHQFRGEDNVTGYITNSIKFMVISRTPAVVENDGKIVGYLFDKSGELSEMGKLAKDDPLSFRKRSWWLIVLLSEDNKVITPTPIKLSLSGAVGAALNAELYKNMQEIENAFFKAIKQPVQSLSEKAKSFFIYYWTLGPCKSKGKSPFEVVVGRKGAVTEPQSQKRYAGPSLTREVAVQPADLETLMVLPSSALGETVLEAREKFLDLFMQRITYYEASLVEPVEESATVNNEEVFSEDIVF